MIIQNHYGIFDSYFDIFDEPTLEGHFYNTGTISKDDMYSQNWDPDAVYWSNYIMYSKKIHHEKKIYGIINMIGDLGGVKEIFISLIGVFLLPISAFSF